MLAALLFVAEIGLIIVAAITCLKIGWVCDIYIQEHKNDHNWPPDSKKFRNLFSVRFLVQ